MTDQQYAYPFDPTGESNQNLIVKESHIISPPDYTDFYFVVPTVGPFFEHNLKVQHWPSGRILVNGVDFILSYKFLGASRATAKPVYGAISILDRVLSGVLEVTYQTLGGPWTIDEAKAAEMLSNATNNPRRTTWEQVVELPHAFPVIDHEWDLVDMVGASDLKDAIDRITDTLLDQVGSGAPGENHATNRDNPHQVTKAQVGLGSVDNFATASFTEGTDPSVNNRFMTPQRVAQLIDGYIANRVDGHIGNTENPHGVTKTQVGLSNVPNYRMADATEAVDPTVDNRFLTPKRVHEAIQYVAIAALDDHKADSDNPHGVTKSQVGLDRVENYGIASDAVARDGSSQIHYLTPHGAQQLLTAKVGEGVGEHVAARDNPHDVTKDQVGLGNVPNFVMTSSADAVAGTAQDQFMSPYHTKLLIESMVADANDVLVDLVNEHTSSNDNPHSVTKEQVGLGSVQNYGISTSTDAIDGVRGDVYMTPAVSAELVEDRITQAFTGFVAEDSSRLEGLTLSQVSSQIQGAMAGQFSDLNDAIDGVNQTVGTNHQEFNDHAADATNPHGVTKSQVGLGNVDNFATATEAEAEDPTNNQTFMTPKQTHGVSQIVFDAGVASVIDPEFQSVRDDLSATNQALADHAALDNNPHQVTKAQVGLGEVDNFMTANASDAVDELIDNRFMTPQRVHEAIHHHLTPTVDNFNTSIAQTQVLINDHIDRTDNPHNVTIAQLGGLSDVQIVGLLSEKLDAADGVAYDADRFGGIEFETYDASVDQRLSDLQDELTSGLGNMFTYPANDSGQAFYRKVFEAQYYSTEWGSLVDLVDTRPLSFIVSGNVGNDTSIFQAVTIVMDVSQNWHIDETSLSDEVESMFAMVVDETNYRIEIWQKVPDLCSDMTFSIQSRNARFEVKDGSTESATAPAAATFSVNRSVGFSYRLAATIEEEFGLLAQDLASIN